MNEITPLENSIQVAAVKSIVKDLMGMELKTRTLVNVVLNVLTNCLASELLLYDDLETRAEILIKFKESIQHVVDHNLDETIQGVIEARTEFEKENKSNA